MNRSLDYPTSGRDGIARRLGVFFNVHILLAVLLGCATEEQWNGGEEMSAIVNCIKGKTKEEIEEADDQIEVTQPGQ